MIGRVIGPYEVTASIGKGGMGEVFRARDARLGRDVALKVLPAELARESERLARFQREARVLASLQHQNIAAIYGLEEADGQPVLAMELAAGEDLSARLLNGALPDNEIDKVARQLALGLEYAHEQGIVHRDLKPANVKVAGDGVVKILDFGLARAFTADSVAEGDAESHSYQPTITQALTGSGTVLGTAAYMSPEQARGYEVDRRSDIWAFGVILYEMMTGERLFEGETATDTLAAVLRKEPDWDKVEGSHPALLVQICRRCLEKDPRQRLRDIGEARVALEGSTSSIMSMSSDTAAAVLPAPSPRAGGSRRPWIAAAALAVVALAAAWAGLTGRLGPPPPPDRPVQSSVRIPGGVAASLAPIAPGPVQASPDGRYLAYAGSDSLGVPRVYVRDLGEGWTRPLNGTEGAAYLFWSPDSREIGFFSDGQIMRVPINGGPAVRIVTASNVKGGSWNQFDQVIYAPTHASSIMMVPATGGDPVALTHIDREKEIRSHRLPQWLPDGRHFIYIAISRAEDNPDLDSMVRACNAESGSSSDLMRVQSSVQYAAGHLLYPHDGLLMARPFNPRDLQFTGPAGPVLDNVLVIRAAHLSAFTVSPAGILAYVRADGGQGWSEIARFSSEGEGSGSYVEELTTVGFDFAFDGRNMCLSIPDPRTGTMDLWQMDLERGLRTRLTFGTESEWGALYSPDGTWLATVSDIGGHSGIYRVGSRGGAALEPLVANDEDNTPNGFSADGRFLYFHSADSMAVQRLNVLDLETGKSRRLHPGAVSAEMWARSSPNGHWLAYVSVETGDREIFVEGLGDNSGRWRVSADGGDFPRWAPDGGMLYFVSGNQTLQAVEITETGSSLRFGAPRVILRGIEPSFISPYTVDPRSGDVALLRTLSRGTTSSLALVTNWTRLLERNRKD